jgi:hypothetical protein
VIDNIPYGVGFIPGHGMDMVSASDVTAYVGWPASLTSSTDSVNFYYSIDDACTADVLPWRVQTIAGKWRKFYAAYHDSSGHLRYFSKITQPTTVTLTTHALPHDTVKTFHCHWDYSLNNPIDSGILYLDDTMSPTDLHSGNEAYKFQATDIYSDAGYPMPAMPFNGIDTVGHYEYHTFAMEWLPNEVRFLVDSVVVRRYPDRLVPPGTPYSDWVTTMPRALTDLRPSQIDFDNNFNDPFGDTVSLNQYGGFNSQMYIQRKYFEHAASVSGWPGFETVDGKSVAHHMIDYIKVWDVPKDVYIPNLPH